MSRLHHKSCVLKYWSENKIKKPELFQFTQVAMAVPCTQENNIKFMAPIEQ